MVLNKNRSRINEVCVHIGLPKTGSTSIQQACAEKVSELREHGIIFPLFRSNHEPENHSMPMRFLSEFRCELPFGNPADYLDPKEVEATWHQALTASDADKMLLSGEALAQMPVKSIQNFKRTLSNSIGPEACIRILLIVRNSVDLYVSWRNEYTKHQVNTEDIAHSFFPANPEELAKLGDILSNWQSVFPEASFSIVKYEDWQSGRGLLAEFSEWAGLPFILSDKKENTSESWELLRLNQWMSKSPHPVSLSAVSGAKGTKPGPIPNQDEPAIRQFQSEMDRLLAQTDLPPYPRRVTFLDLKSEALWPSSFFEELDRKLKWTNNEAFKQALNALLNILAEEGDQWSPSVRWRVWREVWKRKVLLRLGG